MVPASNRSVLYSTPVYNPSGVSTATRVRSNCEVPVPASNGSKRIASPLPTAPCALSAGS